MQTPFPRLSVGAARARTATLLGAALFAAACAPLQPMATQASSRPGAVRMLVVDPVEDDASEGDGGSGRAAIRAVGWATPEAAAAFTARVVNGTAPGDDAELAEPDALDPDDPGPSQASLLRRAMRRHRALVLVDDPADADAVVRPSITFFRDSDARVAMLVRLSADFRRPASPAAAVYREYWYTAPARLAETGAGSWTDARRLAYPRALQAGLARLAAVLARDASGRLGTQASRVITWRERESGRPTRSLLLHETGGYVVVSPIVRGRPMRGVVSVIDRRRMVGAGRGTPPPTTQETVGPAALAGGATAGCPDCSP